MGFSRNHKALACDASCREKAEQARYLLQSFGVTIDPLGKDGVSIHHTYFPTIYSVNWWIASIDYSSAHLLGAFPIWQLARGWNVESPASRRTRVIIVCQKRAPGAMQAIIHSKASVGASWPFCQQLIA